LIIAERRGNGNLQWISVGIAKRSSTKKQRRVEEYEEAFEKYYIATSCPQVTRTGAGFGFSLVFPGPPVRGGLRRIRFTNYETR
jgi:hypothetical protein